jgi:hypothetical protein
MIVVVQEALDEVLERVGLALSKQSEEVCEEDEPGGG